MKEELNAILAPHGWRVGSPPAGRMNYWTLYPPSHPYDVTMMVNLLLLAGYDAQPVGSCLIAVWV